MVHTRTENWPAGLCWMCLPSAAALRVRPDHSIRNTQRSQGSLSIMRAGCNTCKHQRLLVLTLLQLLQRLAALLQHERHSSPACGVHNAGRHVLLGVRP